MTNAGLSNVTVYSVEGPSWALLKATEQHIGERMAANSAMFEAPLTAARPADAYPELLATASHLLAVGHA